MYAPHGDYKLEVRHDYFASLRECIARYRTHGPTFVIGDLNARIHVARNGERDIVGSHVFGDAALIDDTCSNRELLLEICSSLRYCVANTFFEHPPHEQVTYRNLSTAPMDLISPQRFGQIDCLLAPQDSLDYVTDVFSDRMATLSTHHFLRVVDLKLDISKSERRDKTGCYL